MLRDGAMVAGYLDGSEQAAETFTRGVDGLLELAIEIGAVRQAGEGIVQRQVTQAVLALGDLDGDPLTVAGVGGPAHPNLINPLARKPQPSQEAASGAWKPSLK